MPTTSFKTKLKSPRTARGVVMLLMLILLPAISSVRGASWWGSSRDDAQWTNRPPAEIRADAERGNATAQYHYGRALFLGLEIEADWPESFRWTRRAAEQGHAEAQFMTAQFYQSGFGPGRDPAECLAWASRAASKGNADGLALLANAHAYGNGTNRDPVKAIALYRQAIAGGSILALDALGHFYLNAEGRTAPRTNYVEALRCFESAASNGMAHAASHIVEMCNQGLGTPPDPQRALSWSRHFADRGEVEFLESLAAIYSTGTAEPRGDYETPTELWRQAAEKRAAAYQRWSRQRIPEGSLRPLFKDVRELSERYYWGLGTARDYVSAARWLWQAAQVQPASPSGTPRDQPAESPHVYDAIVRGKFSPRSAEKRRLHEAVQLVHRSLDLSDPEATRRIGEMYRDGSALTPQSPISAWIWLNRALALNDVTAKPALTELEKTLSREQIESARQRFLPKSKQAP